MDFSQEVHSLIVRHVGTRNDLLSLCTVSRRFRKEAERALYNTLHLRGVARSLTVCQLIGTTPRLAVLVEALSLFIVDGDRDSSDEDDDSIEEDNAYTDDFWEVVARALKQTVKLHFLSVYFEQIGDTAQAWVLDGCPFQLHTFHCDFEWDEHLESFLNTQTDLSDLFLADFKGEPDTPDSSIAPSSPISPSALPTLACLECTFSEAAMALIPNRPVTRVKTCFSKTKEDEKRTELHEFLTSLRQSRKPLRALDLADESYTPAFSLELLTLVGSTFPNASDLRYLGTLVFPVDSRQRLEFYTRLMRVPQLQCVELEVSDWEPAPMTPAALRALTYELRIYCPSITRVVFVYEFDRVVMKIVDNVCVLDHDATADTLWREI